MDRYVIRSEPMSGSMSALRISYASELNPAQLAAVTAVDGPVLVVAGAGSGKTRTLVYRVAHLVESGVDPSRILLLTFTRRAAQEMLRRASRLLDGRCDRVAGGTFHSFANMILRRHGDAAGIDRAFTILDRGDAENAIDIARAQLGFDRKAKRFPRKHAIAALFSMAVNTAATLADVLEREQPHLLDHLDDLVSVQRAYTAYKAEHNLLDYDDLLVKLHGLLAASEDARHRVGRQYRFVMVDEYQDTNRLQAEIVRLLASEHENVMAVGDDAQSIYSFRGADFRNIMSFPALFPGTRVVTLEENYRSTQPILEATNAIIARARERYTKRLFTCRPGGTLPLRVAAANEQQQSRFVCQRILELREEGVPLSETAVLFRSSFHSFDLEIELARHGLPFVKRGGFKFIESAHIKDALAHLRVIANPRDALSWHRALMLIDGVGPRTGEEIVRAIRAGGDPAAEIERAPGRSNRVEMEALAKLIRCLPEIRSPGDQLDEVVRYYEPLLKRAYPEDYPRRQRDLEQFAAIAQRYRGLEGLLADMALEPPGDAVGDVLAAEADEGLVTLSTIHSAKGLEWHTVFVIWLLDGRFPSLHNLRDDDEMEEERRLLYVAATRAKDNLYLVYPTNAYDRVSGQFLGQPSRFIEDLPEEVLRPVMVVQD